MLTHAQASHNAALCVEKMLAFMRRHGQHFPALYALNVGSPVDMAVAVNDSVLTQDHEDKSPGDPGHKIYRSAMGFQLRGEQDEANIQKAADQIALLLDPDAIALVIACMYAEYEQGEKRPDDLNAEPEAFRIVHASYWLREDPQPMVTAVPYVLNEEGNSEHLEWNSMEENRVNYGLATAAYPWSRPPRKMKTMIVDPYRSTRT